MPSGWRVVACGTAALDVTQSNMTHAVLERERPDVVFHAAAYTHVDAAERDPARAEMVNGLGTAHVAAAAQRLGARLVALSTDYVFDGESGRPYLPEDTPNPLNVYGRSKLAGEREALRHSDGAALVVRTAWVYSASGRNFVRTMLQRMRTDEPLGVVADQVGTPTSARALAEMLWRAAEQPAMRGVHHWTDAGVASWYDFAVAIQEEALLTGLLHHAVPVRPLRSADRPTAARRPPYSVLDKTATWTELGEPARHWRVNLRRLVGELSREGADRGA
jgi:dTDP-4-dehydrorhamnose reductase